MAVPAGRLPHVGAVAHGGLLAVADDRHPEKLVFQQLLLGGLGQQVVDAQFPIVDTVPVHQRIVAYGGPDAAVLSGGEALVSQIDVLVLDAALLEPALGLFGVEGLPQPEDLNVHKKPPVKLKGRDIQWSLL